MLPEGHEIFLKRPGDQRNCPPLLYYIVITSFSMQIHNIEMLKKYQLEYCLKELHCGLFIGDFLGRVIKVKNFKVEMQTVALCRHV